MTTNSYTKETLKGYTLIQKKKLINVTSLLYKSVIQNLCYNEPYIYIYSRLNPKFLVQIGDLLYTRSKYGLRPIP